MRTKEENVYQGFLKHSKVAQEVPMIIIGST